jgi:hypothetical protein
MSLKSILATPLFLVVAATAGAAEQTRQTTVIQDMATDASAAKPTSASGPQRYVDLPPGGFGEPPAPGTRIKAPKGGTKLPAVQKVRDAANRNTQADKHKGHIEVDSLSLGAVDGAQAQRTHHAGGINVVLGDGSVRGIAPKDGACVAGCSNNLTQGDSQQRGQTQTPHVGGMLVGLGDGSVRNGVSPVGGNETITVGSNSTENAKGRGLGSLQGMNSIGQLAAPQGGDQAAGREVRHRSFAIVDRTQTSKDGANTGAVGGNKTQNIGIGRTETTAGGGPNVRVFSGNDSAAGAKPSGNITMKGSTIRQN